MASAIIQSFILAFGLILPLGVQNMFVFNQGATQPRYSKALPVMITASVCDTLLILLAVLGVSTVALGIEWVKLTLMGVGIAFLIYMGWTTWRSTASSRSGDRTSEPLAPRQQVAFALSVSLLNPHAVLDTVGVIGTSSLNFEGEDKVAFTLVSILVSWLWFFGLAYAGRAVGARDASGRLLTGLNKVSAAFMWGTAIYLMVSIVRHT